MSRIAEQIHTALEEDLPSGWSLATIEDLVGIDGVFMDGDWVESKDQDPTGDVRLIQLADIGDGEYRNKSDRFLTHEKALELGCTFLMRDDVLIARMPDPLGRACIFPGDPKKSVTVVDVAIVRSGNGEFNHRWLMYFINAPVFRNSVASLQSGSTRKRISRGNLARLALPVPPREQQNRIVEDIEKQFSRLDEAVTNLKRVKVNLKRYKASVLKAAVEGKLTEDWRKQNLDVEPASKLLERILSGRRSHWKGKGKYKEPIPPDTSNLSPLPQGWMWASVDEVAEILLGKMLDQNKHRTGRRLPYLRNINVRWGRVQTDDLLEMFFESDELDRYGLKPGDVLVCEGGEPGRAAVWDGRISELKYQKALHRVRFYGTIEPRYLVFLLEFLADTGRLERWFTGSTIKHFTRESFISLPIQMPSLKEQEQIVAEVERRLSVIEELEAAVQANLTRAHRLRQSILSRAFEGKLVPQSPSDEPASVLLSRLRGASALKDSLQPKGTRKLGGTTMPKPKAEHSVEIGRMNTKSLYQILHDSKKRLTPEQLFANAGFGPELIDEFYEELKREAHAGRILQERPNKTAIYLKAISNANR